MININRTTCVICQSNKLKNLYTFNKFPIYMGKSDSHDIYHDQVWGICKNCQCVQLLNLIDPKILYKTPHNPAIGKTWENHHKAYAEFINSILDNSDYLLDIGGGNCKLAYEILKYKNIKNYDICDMHLYNNNNLDIGFINTFFDPKTFIFNKKYTAIISSHFVEHIYNPLEYIDFFAKNIQDGGYVIFSFPDITAMLKDKLTNSLNFEHTYQINVNYLTFLMNQFGFVLDRLEYYNKYNPFIAFKKTKYTVTSNMSNQECNKEIFNEYIQFHKANVKSLNNKIIKHKNVFLFGCHVFSQYLLHFGLNKNHLYGIIDNDVNKIGHKLYGYDLFTYPSSIVENLDDVAVIVQAGIYNNEIIEYLLSYNKECNIIT